MTNRAQEMLRTFSDNPTCRHIIFAGCHDSGYLTNLDQFKHNETKANRITLLETTPAFVGFSELPNFKRARFDDVFRKEPLPDSAPAPTHAPVVNNAVAAAQVSSPSAQPSSAPRALAERTPPAMSPSPAVRSPAPGTPAPSVSATDSSEESTWASVGKAAVQRTNSVPLASGAAPKVATKKRYAYFNKKEQRLDERLPPLDKASMTALEQRTKKSGKKMCNNFHVGGACTQGGFCSFQHEPRLPPGELNALKYKARSLPCHNRYCEDVNCCKFPLLRHVLIMCIR